MSRRVAYKKTRVSRKSTPKTTICLCCGGEYYIPFLRQYWSKRSHHFNELKAMADKEDDCAIIYETMNGQNNTHKQSTQYVLPSFFSSLVGYLFSKLTQFHDELGKEANDTPVEQADGKREKKIDDSNDDCTIVYETIGGRMKSKHNDITVVYETTGERKKRKSDDCIEVHETTGGPKKHKHDDCIEVHETTGERKKRKHDDCTVVDETTTVQKKRKSDQAVQVFGDQKGQEQEKNPQEGEYFTQSLQPERIIRATCADGKTKFLVKWENISQSNWVPKEIVNEEYPNIVLKFYEAEHCNQ
ncbi:unnamed protein product [Cercopithifilaria johnstoni]|uniref:Chromo domain-containing protein n=1 Tax=Cercopithifilaria johnstoni TaxID=2874296 RepID=A0A8J2M0T6_9BILA|nr:unnamed protein product [Cercopithifilaria johnstoni]